MGAAYSHNIKTEGCENPFCIQDWIIWALLGALIVFFNRHTSWDQTISNVFFDSNAAVFPLKHNQLLNVFLHDGLRWLAIGIWLGSALLLCLKPVRQSHCQEIVFVLVVSLLATVVVSMLKALSSHSCPWDLSLYGGTANYFRLFQNTHEATNPGPGQCSPSGHASIAFMWIVLLYSSIPWLKQYRSTVAMVVFMVGALAGGVQIAKGAHFVSHILATAWLCWGVTLGALVIRNAFLKLKCLGMGLFH